MLFIYLGVSQTWQPANNMIFKKLREKVQIMKQSPIRGSNVKGSLQRVKMCTTPEVALFQCFRQSGMELLKPPAQVSAFAFAAFVVVCLAAQPRMTDSINLW